LYTPPELDQEHAIDLGRLGILTSRAACDADGFRKD